MSDFWARKLRDVPAAQTPPQASPRPWWDEPTTADQRPALPPTSPGSNPPESASSKALSARETAQCPSCASENYFRPAGSSSAYRCYDCGYPIQHSTSGLSTTEAGKTATPTRQVSTASNYNPGQIIGRIA